MSDRLRREVMIASITQTGLRTDTSQEMVDCMLDRMTTFVPMQPDLFCLPEVFPFSNLATSAAPVGKVAEVPPGPVTARFAEFARRNRCYVICPTYTRDESGHCYNAAVVIDRAGDVIGEYRKTHLTVQEMEGGLTPGTLDPPVFDTDFGRIGVQICFDIEWGDGWEALRRKGAQIVFWPSAFAGGEKLNMLAVIHRYVIAASTRKGSTRIIDISGKTLVASGIWEPAGVCALVNLETAFLHTYPHYQHFDAIRAKYGAHIVIRTFHDEEWTTVESRSNEVRVADVLAEFGIQTHDEMVAEAEARQVDLRTLP